MRVPQSPSSSSSTDQRRTVGADGGGGGGGYRDRDRDRDRDAESLFRTKPISEIRNVEGSTRNQIQEKSMELRQLVGNRYRDLIDSADSIVLMKSSCDSISSNISSIHHGILHSLSSSSSYSSSETTPPPNPNPYPNNNNNNNAKNAKLLSTTNTTTPNANNNNNNNRASIYGIACRVKYLVDTPENIWGCLDESMYLEAAARYIRAKQVHHSLFLINNNNNNNSSILSNFPLLHHQWQIVESFKSQISQRSRDRLLLLDHHALDLDPDLDLLPIAAYADALAAVAVIDDLDPKQVLSLFLHSRKSCISQKLLTTSSSSSSSSSATTSSQVVISTFCQVMKIIQVSVGQVGELFLQVLNDMPLFYKVILGSPPASQLFGGIPNPEEEVRLWKLFRDKLESVTVMLDRNFIAKTCSDWLRSCGKEIVNKINGRYLIDVIANGRELASAEKLIRETMESKQVLEGSIEWLKNVFGSEIELPWNRIRELVLEDDADLWDEIFEDAFVHRMRTIVEFGFDELTKVVHVTESIHAIVGTTTGDKVDFQAYLSRSSMAGGVWFMEDKSRKAGSKTTPQENDIHTCLNAYFGAEVSRIRDSVDRRCESVLEDLLSFLESPKASLRLKDLAPYLQDKCYGSISSILVELRNELEHLSAALENGNREHESVPPPAIVVERSLFIGRLLFAFQKHSRHIPVILGSPRLWVNKTVAVVSCNSSSLLRQSSLPIDSSISGTPGKRMFDSPKRQTSLATAALFGVDDSSSPQLEELSRTTQDLCIRAHNLWISWVSDELSVILSRNLMQDEALSVATASPLRGWEETVVKHEQSDESQSEMKISLPSMPSLYIMSFLFRACEEIHRVGGHVLDKPILKTFSTTLLEKVIGIYADFLSTEETSGSQVSDKGVLQVLLDLRFAADILSGVDCNTNEEFAKNSKAKFSFRRKQDGNQAKSVIQERVDGLVIRLSQKLDPIDWLTYEPYLWENERQSYLRHAVLFGFFVQLNRMYTDTMQKLPTSSESNIMRCSTVPRFKYLPISAPALSSRGTGKTSISRSVDEVSSRSSWKGYTTEELSRKMDMDDDSSFGVATPFLKSFMQVGSRFGESTLKLGSILTDGQVGRFKDKSAAAMSTFGDILPAQAAGLLSSFTATRSDY